MSSSPLSRRAFVALGGAIAWGTPTRYPRSHTSHQSPAAAVGDNFPAHDADLINDIVTAAHGSLTRVRELVEQKPALARACIDWGFGDSESCIDGASHMGRRDIAELLMAHGARATIFTAAMMGHLDAVKACIASAPGVQRTHGPHSLTLLAHARAGGRDAEPVVRYLTALGDADAPPLPSAPLGAAEQRALVGRYRFAAGPRGYFDVDVDRDQLGIYRPGSPARRGLTHVGQLAFYPAGAPAVRIAFAQDGARVNRFTIADPDVFVTATRVG